MKYIIIDDNKKMRDVIREAVSKETDTIMEFNSGEEALDALNFFMPDYILIDLQVKGTDGLETIRKINKKYPDAKVIAISDYDLPSFQTAIRENGKLKFVSIDNLVLLGNKLFTAY